MGVEFKCDNCGKAEPARFNAVNDPIAPSATWYLYPTETTPNVFCTKNCGLEYLDRLFDPKPPTQMELGKDL
jgi:hypothetical protein